MAVFPQTEPYTIPVEEAARLAGLSRSLLFREIRRGALPVVRIGRRTLIDRTDLRRWLDSYKCPQKVGQG